MLFVVPSGNRAQRLPSFIFLRAGKKTRKHATTREALYRDALPVTSSRPLRDGHRSPRSERWGVATLWSERKDPCWVLSSLAGRPPTRPEGERWEGSPLLLRRRESEGTWTRPTLLKIGRPRLSPKWSGGRRRTPCEAARPLDYRNVQGRPLLCFRCAGCSPPADGGTPFSRQNQAVFDRNLCLANTAPLRSSSAFRSFGRRVDRGRLGSGRLLRRTAPCSRFWRSGHTDIDLVHHVKTPLLGHPRGCPLGHPSLGSRYPDPPNMGSLAPR